MPDRQDDLNPVPDLGPFVEALKRLDPQPPNLSRDLLLFAAGQAAAQPRLAPWVWPSIATGFAALSLVLGAFAISPTASAPTIVYVPAPPAQFPVRPDWSAGMPEPPPAPSARPKSIARSADDAETVRMMQVKRDVLRWGVDMLPEPKSSGGPGPSQDVAARQLTRWLNLPPGTFALPAIQPKKPDPKDPDEDP